MLQRCCLALHVNCSQARTQWRLKQHTTTHALRAACLHCLAASPHHIPTYHIPTHHIPTYPLPRVAPPQAVGAAALRDPQCCSWREANSHWLHPYAAFCLMRDLLHSSEHWTWGEAGANPAKVALLCNTQC